MTNDEFRRQALALKETAEKMIDAGREGSFVERSTLIVAAALAISAKRAVPHNTAVEALTTGGPLTWSEILTLANVIHRAFPESGESGQDYWPPEADPFSDAIPPTGLLPSKTEEPE